MTPHRVTHTTVDVTEFRFMTRFESWTFDLLVVARVTVGVLHDLWRRNLDESTWTTAVRWWGWGEIPDPTAVEPDREGSIRLADDLSRARAGWN